MRYKTLTKTFLLVIPLNAFEVLIEAVISNACEGLHGFISKIASMLSSSVRAT